jgi:hypothetical protein
LDGSIHNKINGILFLARFFFPLASQCLTSIATLAGDRFVRGLLLHDYDKITPSDERIHAVPISMLWN